MSIPQAEADLVQLFNPNRGWFLDYGKTVVQQIHAMFVAHLSHDADGLPAACNAASGAVL
ncbi:hypothetical protein AB4Y38_07570 [Paraburkholderia sp. EG285A]|uniref:hypothetical protein n=1 Tax=Paraburkholderia sp. EG285A TaxID=3237009 RepID=UPI0034D3887B